MLRETIRKYRSYAFITQRQMANLLGISVTKYHRKENGSCCIERDEVIKIAKILKLNEKDLLTQWMADNLYELVTYDNELMEKALKLVKENLDHYDNSICDKAMQKRVR